MSLIKSAANWVNTRQQTGAVDNVPSGSEYPAVTDEQGPDVDHTSGNDAPASQESLDRLHQKVSDLAGSVSGMASGSAGGGSGQASQQPGPQSQQREAPVSVLQQQAAAHQQALAGMLAGHENLAQTRARFSQNATNRAQAASAVGVRPAASAVGMSDAYAQQSFYGTQGSANGIAPGTWDSARWSR